MALEDKDLFLVSQATQLGLATTYSDKKVKWSTIKSDLGVRNAKQEVGTVDGISGMMFPDESFDYDELSGRLTIPLDARGVKFVDLLDEDSLDKYPDGTEVAGDFYIVDQADLVVSASKWKGITEVDVVADPSSQTIDIAGLGYSPNNGTIIVQSLTDATRTQVYVGDIECFVEDGKIVHANHIPTDIDLSLLDLETRLFTINVNNTFAFDKGGILECKNVTLVDGKYVMVLSVVSQGEGHRLYTTVPGSISNAIATPQSGEATSFPIDVDIDTDGKVTAITKVALNSGHENGDMFDIVVPYGEQQDAPSVTATFQLVVTGPAEDTLQINDKLIKRADGDWAILVDRLAQQALLTIKNEELNGADLTPALKIRREYENDPRYLTLLIETVTSGQPGLMPPDLFDLLNSYPDTVGGGTVFNILTDDESSIDQLADNTYYTGPEMNPVEAVDIVRYVDEGDASSGEIDIEEQKDVKISVSPATVLPISGGELRVRGTVYIATQAELVSEFTAPSVQVSDDYDRAINAKVAGAQLMPRNLENLSERAEDYKTAKRLKLSTTAYEIPEAGLATVTATLTFEDGTEVPTDETSYLYEWKGIQYPDINGPKDLDSIINTQVVDGTLFAGPTNITCTVTETTDAEYQTISESIYLHFSDASLIPPTPPSIGGISIVGPSSVYVGEVHTYTVALDSPIGDEVIAGTIDQEFATNEGNVVTFTKAGGCRMTATVTSETAVPGTKSTAREIEVLEPVPPPAVLGSVAIIGPPNITEGTQSYTYDYSGTADINSSTWSITNVIGNVNDYSIDENGELTANDSGVVTIQIELDTSEGPVSDTLDVTVVASPSGDEAWDNDPDEKYRIHVIITTGGTMTAPQYNIEDRFGVKWGHKIYNMKTGAMVNAWGGESNKIAVSDGDEFMYIVTIPGLRLTWKDPDVVNGPIIAIGPKSYTAAHDGNYSQLFKYTQFSDVSLLPVGNATNVDKMFEQCYPTSECKIDFTGAKITSAISTFANNKSGVSAPLPPYIGMDTMDMSECVSVEKFLSNTVFQSVPTNSTVTLDWDLSKCEDMSKMMERFYQGSNMKLVFGPKVAPSVGNVKTFKNFASQATSWSQNLSDWCVSSVTPGSDEVYDAFYGTGMSSKTEWHPKWGTCPDQSF